MPFCGSLGLPTKNKPQKGFPVNKFSSIFGQILQIFDKRDFLQAVRDTRSEHAAKGFTCWDQFVAMLFCQLGQAQSLREICGGLATCLGCQPPGLFASAVAKFIFQFSDQRASC